MVIATQNPMALNEFSEPEPDIALLRPPAQSYLKQHPEPQDVLLLIEVADTSLQLIETQRFRSMRQGIFKNAG